MDCDLGRCDRSSECEEALTLRLIVGPWRGYLSFSFC